MYPFSAVISGSKALSLNSAKLIHNPICRTFAPWRQLSCLQNLCQLFSLAFGIRRRACSDHSRLTSLWLSGDSICKQMMKPCTAIIEPQAEKRGQVSIRRQSCVILIITVLCKWLLCIDLSSSHSAANACRATPRCTASPSYRIMCCNAQVADQELQYKQLQKAYEKLRFRLLSPVPLPTRHCRS